MCTEEFIQAAASSIAARLMRLLIVVAFGGEDGGEDPDDESRRMSGDALSDVNLWSAVGRQMGLSVHPFNVPFADEGEYTPMLDYEGEGVVTLNTSYPPGRQCRTLIHEYAHHTLIWPDPPLAQVLTVFGNEMTASVRHRIARQVENIVFDRRPEFLCPTSSYGVA